MRACSGHPALLCYTIGNEIPSPIVRWYGQRRVENFLKRLYRAAKAEDPDGLVTYVNYPSTEFLQLPFLDLVCFNVYLESQERLEAYLARLQNIAGERPLMMGEIGLDSRRNGWTHRRARSTGRSEPLLRPAAQAPLYLRGPMNGTGAATISKTGTSA